MKGKAPRLGKSWRQGKEVVWPGGVAEGTGVALGGGSEAGTGSPRALYAIGRH